MDSPSMRYGTGDTREPDLLTGPNLTKGGQIGLAVGQAVGSLVNNPAIGTALGTGFGLAIGAFLDLAAVEIRPMPQRPSGSEESKSE